MSPHIVAQRLGKAFGDKRVLDDVSFVVAPGDVVGVLGKNGAGKTTLLELMLGFTPVSSGAVSVLGHDSVRLTGAIKQRLGFVPQQDELIDQLSVHDQLRLIASFYASWDGALIEKLVSEWEIDPTQRVKSLSVGQRQKLSILLALGHRPDVLVLDEPVASLDPVARRQFLEQIVHIAADGTRSVIFSSHIVSDVERLANKIWILKDARLHWQGDLDEIKDSVVRVHLRGPVPLPADIELPHALSVQRDGNYATAIVSAWSPHSHKSLESRTGARVEVESLSLEDIFLELHR